MIFDLRGRKIRTLIDQTMPVGVQDRSWDGRNDQGVPAASGQYFYRITIGSFVAERKITLAK